MANKPLRPCRHPGCYVLTKDGWCPKHKPPPVPRTVSAAWHWMYQTPEWQRLRADQLLQEPFCRECGRLGAGRVRATDVDHIRPHRGDWALFADPGNLQSLCHSHHSAKTMREMRENRRKNLSE